MARRLNTEYRLEAEDGQFTSGRREKIQPQDFQSEQIIQWNFI